jgi:hypothetical protein
MAKKIDPREDSIVLIDTAAQLKEFTEGKPAGENARIPVLQENFSWKRSFVNCWTGWPNDGKSTFFQFMMLMKSLVDNWKWCIWSPEMLNAVKSEKGKMIISASDIVDELIFMYTGRNPYKHFEQRYGSKQMHSDDYIKALEWVQEHFIFINPKERKFRSLIDSFRFVYETYGVDGFLVDPFKNIDHSDDGNGRFDLYLDGVFSETKEFALETDTSFNYIAHPRNDKDPKNADGSYKICTQFTLAGGAAWNNNMDGIFSISRPHKHHNPLDPRVAFLTLKQRKQQLVGRAGIYSKIEFDFMTNRYYFDGKCPIDGSYKEPIELMLKREQERKRAEANGNGSLSKKPSRKKGDPGAQPVEPSIQFTEVQLDLTQDQKDEHSTIF